MVGKQRDKCLKALAIHRRRKKILSWPKFYNLTIALESLGISALMGTNDLWLSQVKSLNKAKFPDR